MKKDSQNNGRCGRFTEEGIRSVDQTTPQRGVVGLRRERVDGRAKDNQRSAVERLSLQQVFNDKRSLRVTRGESAADGGRKREGRGKPTSRVIVVKATARDLRTEEARQGPKISNLANCATLFSRAAKICLRSAGHSTYGTQRARTGKWSR